ncbi:hypothetical protein Tco_0455307 [Tanacetum coccineum]
MKRVRRRLSESKRNKVRRNKITLLHQFKHDQLYLEKFDLKSALFKHRIRIKSANRKPNQLPSIPFLYYEALIAVKMPRIRNLQKSLNRPQEKHNSDDNEDDDEDEGPSQTDQTNQDHIPMQDKGNDSDMEDTDNAHIPKVSTTTWFKPIPESERPSTPEPEWTIPPNDFPEPENNWANTYATTYKVPAENKLQRKTYDIGSIVVKMVPANEHERRKLCKYKLRSDKERRNCHYPYPSSKPLVYLDLPLRIIPHRCGVESEREYEHPVRSNASLTGGLGGRNSISTNTVSPLIVKQSDRICEFSVDMETEKVSRNDRREESKDFITAIEKSRQIRRDLSKSRKLCWRKK